MRVWLRSYEQKWINKEKKKQQTEKGTRGPIGTKSFAVIAINAFE